ncbi:MAG: hypothetical protein KJ904_05635 [Alphaproteobacteria bacterium]|nr:hypothetical protein [Alphaproteobacteria bacterium]MBU0797584.1 hypothetical protein [Alphaproteobacteria bacterium]MBU0886628.1 hypothetical protein [Alphaproteobacteria bacterium]MBU1812601.1 hypothetical protein [Alphaproteobacteria bacterium]
MTAAHSSDGLFGAASAGGWLSALRRYIVFIAVANLVWEFAHMPLYTLWETGSTGEIVFAAVHCTGGDILIALSTVMLALFLAGSPAWPAIRTGRVVMLTIAFGLGYTLFSEWLNIEVRQAWAYRDIMPVIPVIDAGLSPVLQWILVPLAAFRFATRSWPGQSRRAVGTDV